MSFELNPKEIIRTRNCHSFDQLEIGTNGYKEKYKLKICFNCKDSIIYKDWNICCRLVPIQNNYYKHISVIGSCDKFEEII